MHDPTDTTLQIGGVAPHVIRELSGVYPTFVSAFKELVSNAYDADATQVTIQLSPDLSTIVVEDNGAGMTPVEFQNEYLRIGGSLQRQEETLTADRRQPIGRKGIGFLAVARYCRLVEVHSHAEREVAFWSELDVSSQAGMSFLETPSFLQEPFASVLAPFVTAQSVRCGDVELSSTDYHQNGWTVELAPEANRQFKGQALTIRYTINCRLVDLIAKIDYDYLLDLDDEYNLETLSDFCHVRLASHGEILQSLSIDPGQSFTRVTLHLREFVQRELQALQRRGRVRNIASASGLDRFLWHLSRSVPVSYELSDQQLERHNLGALRATISPTPFTIQIIDPSGKSRELKRPLLGELGSDVLGSRALIRQHIRIESNGLAAQGYLLGFPVPVFPAELRGIAIRVRGVEIGESDFLGIEDELPVKYRPFLNNVMGEIIVTEGLDAISAIMPGREGFYAENPEFQMLRRHLVGEGVADRGELGTILCKLREQHSVESSVARIVQEAKRRRKAFLDVSQAITALSVGAHYGRNLRRLFSRHDISANGLCHAQEYETQLPGTIGDYALEESDSMDSDYEIDPVQAVVRLNRKADMWNLSLYMLGRDFAISLRSGKAGDPLCEVDLTSDTIYLNWLHPTRGKMGDAMFIKSAIFWRIAYLAASGDVDLMMNLAHHLLSSTAD